MASWLFAFLAFVSYWHFGILGIFCWHLPNCGILVPTITKMKQFCPPNLVDSPMCRAYGQKRSTSDSGVGVIMSFKQFVLAGLTPFVKPVVICFQDKLEYEAFKGYARLSGTSYHTIDEADATKLLVSGDCVGHGCYTMFDGDEDERYYRKALAASRMIDVALFTGFIMRKEPVEVGFVAHTSKDAALPAFA